jgi:hypothetical protein
MYHCVALGDDQLMMGDPGLLVRDVLGGQHIARSLRFPRCSQDPAAFTLGGGGEPAMRRGQITDSVKRLVAASGPRYQVSDRRVTTHRVGVLSGGRTGPRLAAAMKMICQPGTPPAATA